MRNYLGEMNGLNVLFGFVLAIAISIAAIGLGPGRSPGVTSDGEGILACCLRQGKNADTSSALLQQEVASAIVKSGAKIIAFRAPRATQKDGVRRLRLNVSMTGSEQSILRALDALKGLPKPLGLADAIVTADVTGEQISAQLQLVQWSLVNEEPLK